MNNGGAYTKAVSSLSDEARRGLRQAVYGTDPDAKPSRGFTLLRQCILSGRPGEVVVYHTGESLMGCDSARLAMLASDAGLVHLTQERLTPPLGIFAYRAERRAGAL